MRKLLKFSQCEDTQYITKLVIIFQNPLTPFYIFTNIIKNPDLAYYYTMEDVNEHKKTCKTIQI